MSCRPTLYIYDADTHCTPCALERFGSDGLGHVPEGAKDSEGNEPGALARWDHWETEDGSALGSCGTCRRGLCTECGATFALPSYPLAFVEPNIPETCANCGAWFAREYWSVDTIVEGALDSAETFTTEDAVSRRVDDIRAESEKDRLTTEVFVQYHGHAPGVEDCACTQYETDHHPTHVFNAVLRFPGFPPIKGIGETIIGRDDSNTDAR